MSMKMIEKKPMMQTTASRIVKTRAKNIPKILRNDATGAKQSANERLIMETIHFIF